MLAFPDLGRPPLDGDMPILEAKVKCFSDNEGNDPGNRLLLKDVSISLRFCVMHTFNHFGSDELHIRQQTVDSVRNARAQQESQETEREEAYALLVDDPRTKKSNQLQESVEDSRAKAEDNPALSVKSDDIKGVFSNGVPSAVSALGPLYSEGVWFGNDVLTQKDYESDASVDIKGIRENRSAGVPAKKGARVRGFVAGCENGFAYVFCKYKHDYKWHFQNTSSNHSHIASGDAGLQGMDSRTTLVAKRRGSRIQRRGAHKIADPEKCTQFYFSPNMPFSVAAILVSDGNIYEPGYNVELMREYAKKQGELTAPVR